MCDAMVIAGRRRRLLLRFGVVLGMRRAEHYRSGERAPACSQMRTGRLVVIQWRDLQLQDFVPRSSNKGIGSTPTPIPKSSCILRQYGEACVQKMRGWFAFAVWDGTAETDACPRPPGDQALFYSLAAAGLAFGSELESASAASGITSS